MKVLIDAFPLNAPKSGVGYYTYHLLHALRRAYAGEDDFLYFYGRRFSRRIAERPPALDAAARRTLKTLFANPYKLTQPIKEILFRVGARTAKPDVYHETNYVLLPFRGPQVVTVFDLSVKRFPETHPSGRVRFFNKYFDQRLPRADHILAISEFTKQELVEIMGVAPGKITVSPLAPPASFPVPASEEIERFRHKRQLPEDFFLYLGNLEPRKNLVLLLRAYEQLVARHSGSAPALVLAGEPTWLSESIFDEVDSLGLRDHVVLPGYVPEAELPLWYGSALAFVYPSLYEGFGLPLVEAMAVGTPVLAARAASLPEVAGDAAILLPTDDVDAWTNAMDELAQSPEKREFLRERGLARAALYSWEQCAEITHNVYEKVAGGN